MKSTRWLIALGCCALAHPLAAQDHEKLHKMAVQACEARKAEAARNPEFAALQARGKAGMGVDQYTSTHTFEALPDGGRILYVSDNGDKKAVEQIRKHLGEIAKAFAAGDFSTPSFIHAGEVPGAAVLTAQRSAIRYAVANVENGAELRLRSDDAAVLAAIREFMDFQNHSHNVC